MKHTELEASTFIPTDILRAVNKIKETWTKLTEGEIAYYLEGKRDALLTVLQTKYSFSKEQAESTLSTIERLV